MVLLDQACQQIRGVRLDLTMPDGRATFELLRSVQRLSTASASRESLPTVPGFVPPVFSS
jgi:hypothetical protein